MTNQRILLVVGATGSIGRLVVEETVTKGYVARALARDPGKANRLFPDVEVVVGDLRRPETLSAAVESVDAIIFTHGSDGRGKAGADGVSRLEAPWRTARTQERSAVHDRAPRLVRLQLSNAGVRHSVPRRHT